MGFLPFEIRVAFPGESQLPQDRATQPTVHTGCFSVSIIRRTLTWTTRSLACAQMLMHAIAHGVVRTHARESALKVDSERIKSLTSSGNRTCVSVVPVWRSIPIELQPHPKHHQKWYWRIYSRDWCCYPYLLACWRPLDIWLSQAFSMPRQQ